MMIISKRKLTLNELTNYLKKTRNNVSPGSTGFTGDFYKFYYNSIKIFILNSINYSFETGSMSISNKLGIITLIPKSDKDALRGAAHGTHVGTHPI